VLGLDENKVKAAIADSYKDSTLRLDGTGPSKDSEETSAELQSRKRTELNEFAARYLEKLIHLVIPIPLSQKETVETLLGLRPPSNEMLRAPRWRMAAKSVLEMLGTALLVASLILSGLGLYLAASSLPKVSVSSTAHTGPSAVPDKPSQEPILGPAGSLRVPPETSTAEQSSGAGLTTGSVLGTLSPLGVLLAFALLLITILVIFKFLPRMQPEPVVSDGPEFKKALRIWLKGIVKTRDTPRAVKRFVNRLRFMAMRLRDLSAVDKTKRPPLDEAGLVALAVIEDLNNDYLGETDNELQKQQASGGGGAQDAAIILAALEEFRREFGRDPYADELALPTFRLLAGLVVEGRAR
jgi:hypothetical protein